MFEPVAFALRLPVGVPIPVDVIDAVPALSQYRIRVRVSHETWERIDLLDLFHLTADARHPGKITGDGDVEIELRLADAEVRGVIGRIAGLTPRNGVVELSESPGDSPVFLTESWFALEVTEAVDLPPELQGPDSSLRSGFTTTWATASKLETSTPQITVVVEKATKPEDEPWPALLRVVRDYLVGHDIPFERHARADMVSADIDGEHGSWSLWIHTREADREVLVYSIRPEIVAEARRADVSTLIDGLNARTSAGAFEMDPDEGGFRCSSTLTVDGPRLDASVLEELVAGNVTAMDGGLLALGALLDGTPVGQALDRFPR